jgi:hypothetical protein
MYSLLVIAAKCQTSCGGVVMPRGSSTCWVSSPSRVHVEITSFNIMSRNLDTQRMFVMGSLKTCVYIITHLSRGDCVSIKNDASLPWTIITAAGKQKLYVYN